MRGSGGRGVNESGGVRCAKPSSRTRSSTRRSPNRGKHFKFDDDGITDEIVAARRASAYFIPVAQPKKKGKQLELGTEWTDDRLRENDYINEVRAAVGDWRRRDYPGDPLGLIGTAGMASAFCRQSRKSSCS